jgi:hypothetical protein
MFRKTSMPIHKRFYYLNSEEQSRDISRFDLHGDVEIKSDSESFEGVQMTTSGTKEVSRFNFIGARDDSGLIVFAPFADLAVSESEPPETSDKALCNFLKMLEAIENIFLIEISRFLDYSLFFHVLKYANAIQGDRGMNLTLS